MCSRPCAGVTYCVPALSSGDSMCTTVGSCGGGVCFAKVFPKSLQTQFGSLLEKNYEEHKSVISVRDNSSALHLCSLISNSSRAFSHLCGLASISPCLFSLTMRECGSMYATLACRHAHATGSCGNSSCVSATSACLLITIHLARGHRRGSRRYPNQGSAEGRPAL